MLLAFGIVFRFWKCHKKIFYRSSLDDYTSNTYINSAKKTHNVNMSNIGAVLGESISNSIYTVLNIGGFVVLFSVIISILQNSHFLNLFTFIFDIFNIPFDIGSSTILGMIEITNGISIISSIALKKISINIVIIAFLLGFGGISVMLQVWSIVSKSDLSIKPYIIGKILHGIFAATFTYLFIHIFPFFYFDL